MNRKVVGGKHNVLVHYVEVCAPNLSDVLISNPFIWDILWFILVKNLVICVPATLAKWILFHNHRNKKRVGGKHNVLVHYVNVCAPDPAGILWFILIINLVFCVCNSSETKFIPQTQEQKGCRRQTQCSNTLCECLCTWPIHCFLWNHFKWDIFWFILIKNLVIFVPTTLAKQILSCNHSNKKVVGGKHNVLIHDANASAPDSLGVVLCNTFRCS